MKKLKYLPTVILSTLTISLFSGPIYAQSDVTRKMATEINQTLKKGWQERGVTPTKIIDDATFLRRNYFLLAGRIPTLEEARSFYDSKEPSAKKREDLVNALVDGPGMSVRLINLWGDLLRVKKRHANSGTAWSLWLDEAVRSDMPYDEMVYEMLASTGHPAENPAVGFYLRDANMLLDNVAGTIEIFLGHQIGCAQCHDHPFDEWTQKDYYSMAAFLGGTDYRSETADKKAFGIAGGDPGAMQNRILALKKERKFDEEWKQLVEGRKLVAAKVAKTAKVFGAFHSNAVSDKPGSELTLPYDYQYDDGEPGDAVEPITLFGDDPRNVPLEDRRRVYAEWVTSEKNPYFAKVGANRLWDFIFGYGLVPQLNDVSNGPPSYYPELMSALEYVFVKLDFSVKEFIRVLAYTNLYQREVVSTPPTAGRPFDFPGPVMRRMEAEAIYDSLLTLKVGNPDNNRYEPFEDGWNIYLAAFSRLMEANAQEVDALAEEIKNNRAESDEALETVVKLKAQARKAKESGDTKLADTLNKKVREAINARGRIMRYENADGLLSEVAPAFGSVKEPRLPTSTSPNVVRANETLVPAGAGTMLRNFGGSDRMLPSSRFTYATIPQVLELINGQKTFLELTSNKGFAAELKSLIGQDEAQLDTLFMAIYSRPPTDIEKRKHLPRVSERGYLNSLAQAMISSNQFLFIQ